MSSPLLRIENLGIEFGGLKALDSFCLEMNKGDLFGLIGPNGAGKTTVFNLLTGVYVPSSGQIFFNGRSIAGLSPHLISKMGLARTFQNIRLFRSMSALDNVLLGCHQHICYGLRATILKSSSYIQCEQTIKTKALELLQALHLEHKKNEMAANLPYGDQRRLEIARALATQPSLLLLDEPGAGMNASETIDLMNIIQNLRKYFNLTILLIEHDMKLVMGLCEQIVVLNYGVTLAQARPEAIQQNPKVIQAYLGVDYDIENPSENHSEIP